jgi:glucose/arabinose dehydrogenase
MKRLFPFGAIFFLALAVVAQPLPKIKLERIFPQLKVYYPVWMTEAPDGSGRFFIVEQGGRIIEVAKGSDGAQSNVFLNIIPRNPHAAYEEGLLSLAFHPGFKTNGLCYIYYNQEKTTITDPYKDTFWPRMSVISEWKVSATNANELDPLSERVLLRVPQPFANHKGGELVFGRDGFLYCGLGDGGLATDPFNNAQNSASLLGKMIRIDVNARETIKRGTKVITLPYGIPQDNPFVNEPDLDGLGARHEVYALGLRNPWRYSFDRQTGDLWVGDVGQDLWEEVDRVEKGGNYGWNVREGAHHFKPGPPGAVYADPVIEYPHQKYLLAQSKFDKHSVGACVIGGYVYRGAKHPELNGVYFYADFTLGSIFGLRYADGKVTDYGTVLEQPKNVSSFAEDLDGELYVLTFGEGPGFVYSVVPQ